MMDDNDADQKEIVLKCEDDINIDTEKNEKDHGHLAIVWRWLKQTQQSITINWKR